MTVDRDPSILNAVENFKANPNAEQLVQDLKYILRNAKDNTCTVNISSLEPSFGSILDSFKNTMVNEDDSNMAYSNFFEQEKHTKIAMKENSIKSEQSTERHPNGDSIEDLISYHNNSMESRESFYEVSKNPKSAITQHVKASKITDRFSFGNRVVMNCKDKVLAEVTHNATNMLSTSIKTRQSKKENKSIRKVNEKLTIVNNFQINEIFNNSKQNELKRKSLPEISGKTCLRYVKLKEILNKLEDIAIQHYNTITKVDFIRTTITFIRFKGLSISTPIPYLSQLYDIIKGKEKTSVEELAGALSVLCSGSTEERIKTSLLYIGVKNNLITSKIVRTYLLSLYRLLLRSEALKADNVTAEELARVTALKCFEVNGNAKTIRIEDFIRWFSSQAKTLIPQVSGGNTPRTITDEIKSIEVTIKPIINTSEISSDTNSEAKEQWQDFLSSYYLTYGFYPPPPPSILQSSHEEDELKKSAHKLINTTICNKRNRNLYLNTPKNFLKTYEPSQSIASVRTSRGVIANASFRQKGQYYC